MAYDEKLADRIRESLTGQKKVAEKKMFGGVAFMVNDKMCVGVTKDEMMARIDPEIHDEALKKKGCRVMDFTGRPMRGYVFVSPEGVKSKKELDNWIRLALDFNSKAKKAKKEKVAATKSFLIIVALIRICFLLLVFAIISSSCYRKCKDKELEHYYFHPAMENYFGVYKPDNWWTYENQTDTLKDSLYVYDFTEKIEELRLGGCLTYPIRNFKVSSQYLIPGQSYLDAKHEHNPNCCSEFFGFIISAHLDSKTDTHPTSACGIPEVLFDSLTLNSVLYNDVLYFECLNDYKAYFAPQIGMIRFITPANDTFTISNYHIN